MILHIGNKEMVFLKDIVAIIRYDALMLGKEGKSYVNERKANKQFYDISGGRQNTLVVLSDGTCYLTAISAQTLLKRYEAGGLGLMDEDAPDPT